MTKRLVGIGLMILVFLGSIGIPIYRHSCSHEQITIQTLFTKSDHCDQDIEVNDTCCEDNAADDAVDDRCCTDEIKRLSLAFDYVESSYYHHPVWTITYPLLPQSCLTTEIRFAHQPVLVAQFTEPPPKPLGERLPVNCSWRL